VNPVMAGFTEQQAAVLMNNSLSVWKHYDREKSPRDQQHVANVSPGMFSRLADMHSGGKATAAAAAAAAAATAGEDDDYTDVSSSNSSDYEGRDQQRVRQRTSSAVAPDIQKWLKDAVDAAKCCSTSSPIAGCSRIAGSLQRQEVAHTRMDTGVLHAVCVCVFLLRQPAWFT
jgi:hypothetical protein